MMFVEEKHKVYQNVAGGLVMVKVGWSWWPVLFGVVWAMYHRLWGVALAMVGFAVTLIVLLVFGIPEIGEQHSTTLLLTSIIIERLFWGFRGERFLEKRLLHKGFTFVECKKVNKVAADLGYFEHL